MGRLITPRSPVALTAGESATTGPDSTSERVLKYIPAEVVAFYVAAIGIVDTVADDNKSKSAAYVIIFLVGMGAAPAYVWKLAGVGQPKRFQMFWAALAFAIWGYTLGGPFKLIDGLHQPWIGSLLLLTVTLVAGLFSVPAQGKP
jgi:hypothetical protein